MENIMKLIVMLIACVAMIIANTQRSYAFEGPLPLNQQEINAFSEADLTFEQQIATEEGGFATAAIIIAAIAIIFAITQGASWLGTNMGNHVGDGVNHGVNPNSYRNYSPQGPTGNEGAAAPAGGRRWTGRE